MKLIKIMIIMLVLIMSLGAVCATDDISDEIINDDGQDTMEILQNDVYTSGENSFSNLNNEIKIAGTSLDLNENYTFNNATDNNTGILINRDNFVLNGNGHTINGNNQSRLFSITGNNITINDLILINGNYENCAGIRAVGTLTLNNVTFINNYANGQGGAIGIRDSGTLICNNTKFIDNYADTGSAILDADCEVKLYNSYITAKNFAKGSQIHLSSSSKLTPAEIYIENTTFANITTSYAPALYLKSSKASIIKSKFLDLNANITAGGIGTKEGGELYIKDCEFKNVTSSKNGGAIYADVSGENGVTGKVTIIDTKFADTYSEFGGAYLQLGGDFVLNNTEFKNSHAKYNGGAIYLSHTNTEINNSTFDSNDVSIIEGYPTYGGAIYSDKSTLNVTKSKFFNNVASAGSAIYAYDTSYNIKNSTFENNTNPIYTVFDGESNIDQSNVFNNDENISTNNTYYATIITGQGLQLVLLNNTINTTTIPDSFDLRDYGWVSSIKNQGWMGSCWTFGMTGTLESALLKAANITTDFSENNMQNTMIKYSIYGSPMIEGGLNTISADYLLSWLGAFTQDADTYDEMGKISPIITTQNDIHIQDVMFTPNNEIPNGTLLKLAIMNYGSIDVSFFGQATFDSVNPYYNPETHAQYVNESINPNHEVSIIGWDDNYNASNFLITPPGNGAWIVKNSYGTEWGDNGYLYVSYYDETLINNKDVTNYATSIIIENTEPYNKNYQYSIMWGTTFKSGDQNVSYMNVFEALEDDLIAAVGTYFDKEGNNYTVKIYVNDELKLTQTGVSPYLGYHTIKLNEYIPIKEGDVFKAAITSNAAPYVNLTDVRPHYTQNLSFISFDGENWEDTYDLDYITCLKVYTVADSSNTTNTFTELERLINASGQYLTLDKDYAFNNETDNPIGIIITKDNFVLNGNGHTVDAKNLSRIFGIGGNNITLTNLVLINANTDKGGAVYCEGTTTLDNITFINNNATVQGGAVGLFTDLALIINNSRFINNYAGSGPSIYVENGNLSIYNTEFTSNVHTKGGQVILRRAIGYIDNATFANIVSDYSPAIQLTESKALTVLNSKFVNLTANITSGAINVKDGGEIYIRNCEFTNTTSSKNAGAILADITGYTGKRPGNVTIVDSVFRDTSSGFGGAYIQFGGKLLINNTEFTNNHATYNGGSVYISYVDAEVNDCNFTSNGVDMIENYPTYGGAMVIDMSTITINNSRFINNTASKGNAIYGYDASYSIKNSLFENDTNDIYTFFDKEHSFENNTLLNDNISINNTFYATIKVGEGIQLTLLNNTISVDTLPSKFDLRDWGWVSPVRDQGWMGACWTFGMTGTLESALLKATGIAADLSENNMQNTMLQYSTYGLITLFEGGGNIASVGYLLSWLGAFTQDADTYDEIGKLSPLIITNQDIHVQDVMFTPNNEMPNGTQLKLAIMKYGSIDVSYNGQSTYSEVTPYYNPETYAQYVNDSSISPNHAVSIVGWDDNFPKEKFGIEPPGNGAWIVKNSWGPSFGENGYLYVSYYDQTLLQSTSVLSYATSIIIENTEPYNKNYQYDTVWGAEFAGNGTVKYMNVFEALETDAIAAVGTYFNQSGINYTVEIYVNDVLKLTQEGVSPYYGYHTIKLDKYIPIKEGDVFKAIITSNGMPKIDLKDTRVHYTNNISFISFDGETWEDAYDLGYIACLKVYTVAIPFYSEDFVKTYKNDSEFEVNIGVANETVTFEINGKNYTRTSDENGTAKMTINLIPGNFTVKTTFNGTTVENNITVLSTFIAENLVKYYRNASQFYIDLVDGEGNPVSGAIISMNINGIIYNRTTNENGTAKLNINLPQGEYILTATDPLTGLQMSYNITVLPTLNATDLEMKYKDGSTFNVTVLDNQGNPLADAVVTFNINGEFYNRTSDSSGIARLNINLIAGEYIITSEYDGLRISNTITIKD